VVRSLSEVTWDQSSVERPPKPTTRQSRGSSTPQIERSHTCTHRRSQWGQRAMPLPKISCITCRFVLREVVSQSKCCFLLKDKIFGPSQYFRLATLLHAHKALAIQPLLWWGSLLRNMLILLTNFSLFHSRYQLI